MRAPDAGTISQTNLSTIPASVDVAVIGGGPAGLATAIAATRHGLRVIVVERLEHNRWRPGEMLSPGFMPLAQQLGIWPQFLQQNFRQSPGVLSFWDSDEPSSRDFIQSPFGSGWSIERPAFDRWLANCARAVGVSMVTNASVQGIEQVKPDLQRLNISTDSTSHSLQATQLVDATGSMASIARQRGARRIRSDQLIALVVHLPALQRDDSRLMLEACEVGWWYCMAQPSGGVVVALITDADLLHSSDEEPLGFWHRQLSAAPQTAMVVGSRFEGLQFRAVGAPTAYLSQFAGNDWVAVGDAAISFDPLSASGIQRAIESGLRTGRALGQLLHGNRDELTNYIHWQQQSLHQMIKDQHLYYRMVTRWPQSLFWTRRQSTS